MAVVKVGEEHLDVVAGGGRSTRTTAVAVVKVSRASAMVLTPTALNEDHGRGRGEGLLATPSETNPPDNWVTCASSTTGRA